MLSKPKKKSFFERLTGSIRAEEEEEIIEEEHREDLGRHDWLEQEEEEAELAIDMYQTPTEVVIQTMVAGVRPEDLELTIARDMVSIKGKREKNQLIDDENYFAKELYWGKFARTVLLPQEVEPEQAEALEKNGLLTMRLQKVDKEKKNVIRVKSI